MALFSLALNCEKDILTLPVSLLSIVHNDGNINVTQNILVFMYFGVFYLDTGLVGCL